MELLVRRLHDAATIPTRAHADDAGWDLYALEDADLRLTEHAVIRTGIALAVPDGHVGLICERSSLGSRGISLRGGVIDAGYRGEIKVVLHHLGFVPGRKHGVGAPAFNHEPLAVKAGDKIAQILLLPIPSVTLREVDGELPPSARGTGGFGSSGR